MYMKNYLLIIGWKFCCLEMKVDSLFLFLLTGTIIYSVPASVQMPFRVLSLLFIDIFILYTCREIRIKSLFLFVVTAIYIVFKFKMGTFDTSLLILLLSVIPVCFFDKMNLTHTGITYRKIKWALVFWLISIIIQMSFFRYNGRPTLSYEINQSGSYLFLFYLLSSVFGFNKWKIIIILLSLLLLSRLLIISIVLFEFIRVTKYVIKPLERLITYTKLMFLLNISIAIFSFWFIFNMNTDLIDGGEGKERLVNLNDQSNFIRFKINATVVYNLFSGEDKRLLKDGYGDLGKNAEYREAYFLMPHNELLKGIAQFGIWFTLFCLFISRKGFSPLVNYHTVEYFIPIVVYTLILWVKFSSLPSLEMLFILFVLKYKLDDKGYKNSNCYI